MSNMLVKARTILNADFRATKFLAVTNTWLFLFQNSRTYILLFHSFSTHIVFVNETICSVDKCQMLGMLNDNHVEKYKILVRPLPTITL